MIATDGSVCSRIAASRGIELARLSGGTVYAVYVVSTEYFSSMAVDFDRERMYEALRKEGCKAVSYINEIGELKNVNVETVLLEGHPADELIRFAEEEKMDIIVMGMIGRTGLDRLILGSVAEKVIRHSKVPVMVVKEKCDS
ncbi:MAG: universal stress protein [Methanosarcina thermophila]|jgi:nucleotide-binding universal stress UspA family protein|uniref:Universal stress protein n=3 Tax=Methanosarcina thermophila TaxID=2210 RepID=A0A1I7AAI6_METTE|nr:universal stress protein [Methanosarcina thermophila]AKB12135.1 Universal stress protein [Methanosarcina thermophila TM-1]AKB14662.1 Universal stress protein [Methanosarcina thermophila CHTI-55]SFT71943.1 Nucleotide-binding universal stress protein, UspA family [Methanosarcina thermophila]BAW29780.1 universal stress protein [Methanosarcina thermophila]GLI15448.1 universal stress protein [Methanosarcina thermophila MST-A1]